MTLPPAFPLPFVATAAGVVALANLATVGLFWIDKRRAIRGERRLPESTLLFAAFLGGWPGAYWARARFRHKTRKQPFSMQLHLIALLQGAGLVMIAIEKTRQGFGG